MSNTNAFEEFISNLPLHNDNPDKPKTEMVGSPFLTDEELLEVHQKLDENPDILELPFEEGRTYAIVISVDKDRGQFGYIDDKGIPMGGSISNLKRVIGDPNIIIKEGDFLELDMEGMEMKTARILNTLSGNQKQIVLIQLKNAYNKRKTRL